VTDPELAVVELDRVVSWTDRRVDEDRVLAPLP
jgi:hypothetical protein